MTHPKTLVRLLLLAIGIVSLIGCASTQKQTKYVSESDPLEGVNRKVYKFNDALDKAILKPVAKAYDKTVPKPVDRSIDNLLGNLSDVITLMNDIFQLKGKQSMMDYFRIGTNTTLGLGGLFDVATPLGLPKHNEDFGQTLGRWGVPQGPYVVLPFLGPSNIRDGVGLIPDSVATSALLDDIGIDELNERLIYTGLSVVNRRQALLDAEKLLEASGADPYTFIRESYLQRRQSLVNDGAIEETPLDDAEEDALFGDDE